ncbi:hypothetical protein GWK47_045601 [Chionoecetes opilio]|uniref:Uncharacterized protein n=1 Tax=Chionoecetes opilio TaxID=41210 RepID=A0A8J5CHG7_CHIOP|nr:hypothetical protein GWK47_045601 [Chionoecetes opilio]
MSFHLCSDDAVIFAESLEVLVMALEALHEEAKPLGLEVWPKTKIQVFGGLQYETVQSVHACGKDIEKYLAWGTGNKSLTFNQMISIMLDLKVTAMSSDSDMFLFLLDSDKKQNRTSDQPHIHSSQLSMVFRLSSHIGSAS